MMIKSKLGLMLLSACFALSACSGNKLIKVVVNNSEATLTHQAYESEGVVFADALEFLPYLGGDAEYSSSLTVCVATFNNLIMFIEAGLSTFVISDLNTQITTTYNLQKPSKKTDHGIDVSISDIGESLKYSVTRSEDILSFKK